MWISSDTRGQRHQPCRVETPSGSCDASNRQTNLREKLLDVSVVVPAFNRSDFIVPTLQSVQAQTLQPREIIVVDDGSTDDTADVAERHGATVVRRPNGGIGAARNTGIEASSGEWIALLDADDLWAPDKLETVARAVELCPGVGVVFSDMEQFDAEGTVHASFLRLRTNFASVAGRRVADDILCCDPRSLVDAFHRGNFVNPSTLVFRRALLGQAGMVDATLNALEDREHVLRLFHRAQVAVCTRPLVRYRLHENQFSNDSSRMLNGVLQMAERVFENPASYPPGSVDVYRVHAAKARYELGLLCMKNDRFSDARTHLWASFRARPGVRPLAAALIATSGRTAYSVLLGLKRRLALPGLARKIGPREQA